MYDDNKIFTKKEDNNRYCSIDLGINNFSTLANNFGELPPIIINGKVLKSNNQYYNKKLSKLQSQLSKENRFISKRTQRLTQKRNNKLKDNLHKISKYVQNYCIDLNISRVIIGYNKQWKTNINLSKKTNQKFVQIPYLTFITMLTYKLKDIGI